MKQKVKRMETFFLGLLIFEIAISGNDHYRKINLDKGTKLAKQSQTYLSVPKCD